MKRQLTTLQKLVLRASYRGVVIMRHERNKFVYGGSGYVAVWRAIERECTGQVKALWRLKLVRYVRCKCPVSKLQAYATAAGIAALRRDGMI